MIDGVVRVVGVTSKIVRPSIVITHWENHAASRPVTKLREAAHTGNVGGGEGMGVKGMGKQGVIRH